MQNGNDGFALHAEETDLDGNLISWLLEDERQRGGPPPSSTATPNAASAYLPPLSDYRAGSAYFYEGFGMPPSFPSTYQATTTTGQDYMREGSPQPPPPLTKEEFFPATMDEDFEYLQHGRRQPGLMGQQQPRPQQSLMVPELTEPLQGSSEQTSARRTVPPTTAQVKNRRAQKKFRERQKAKMVGLAEEVEVLRKRVENLSVQNRDLGNSNMLLNKVVKMRDKQMNILKEKTQALITRKENPEANNGNGKIPELLLCSDAETLSMERSMAVVEHLTANFPASKFCDLDDVRMRQVWKGYVDRLSGLLVNNDSDPGNQKTLEEIHIAVGELGEICMQCATLSPSSMCSLISRGETDTSHPVDSDEVQAFWENVLIILKLSPEQEHFVLELRKRFLDHLEATWKRRTILSNKLQSFVSESVDAPKSNLVSCGLAKGVRELLEELKETVFTDSQYHTDFIASFFQLVLNDLQTARVFVQSFPYYPDVLQLANLVYRKHQHDQEQEPSQSAQRIPMMSAAAAATSTIR